MIGRFRKNNHLAELIIEASLVKNDSMKILINYVLPDNYDQDIISKIKYFLFPFGDSFESYTVEQFIFTLTDSDGKLTYGFCRLSNNFSSCLCIISCYSCFEIFYRLLNEIASLKNTSSNEKIREFISSILEIKDILPGSSFELLTLDEIINFDFPNGHTILSLPQSKILTEYFCAFDSTVMMKLFASMLNERRIIITSLKLNRITSIIHTAVNLLYPLVWQHILISILPSHLLDYLSAPMPYIIGIHSSLWKGVHKKDIGDVVIVDADDNNIITPFQDLAAMPNSITYKLKKKLSVKNTKKNQSFLGNRLSLAFLNSMISLLGNYREGLKLDGKKIIFDIDLFISKQNVEFQNYLIQISKLQMFHEFVNSRVDLIGANVSFNDVFEKEIFEKENNKKNRKNKMKIVSIDLIKKGIKKLEMDPCFTENSLVYQTKHLPNVDKNQNIMTCSPKNSFSNLYSSNIFNLEDDEKLVNLTPRTPRSHNSSELSKITCSSTLYSQDGFKSYNYKNDSEPSLINDSCDYPIDKSLIIQTSVSNEDIFNSLPDLKTSTKNNSFNENRKSNFIKVSLPFNNNIEPLNMAGDGLDFLKIKNGIDGIKDGSFSSLKEPFDDSNQYQTSKVSKKISVQEIIKLYETKDANVKNQTSRPNSQLSEISDSKDRLLNRQFEKYQIDNLCANGINNIKTNKSNSLNSVQNLKQQINTVNNLISDVSICNRTSTINTYSSQSINCRTNSQKGLSRTSAFKRNSTNIFQSSTNQNSYNKIPSFGIDYNKKNVNNNSAK